MARNPRFDNIGGVGDRTASIGITTTLTISVGTVNNLIDGGLAANSTDAIQVGGSQSGREIAFDFGLGNTKKITGFVITLNAVNDPTLWKLTASNDNVTYVDITGNSADAEVSTGEVKWANSTGTNDGFYRYYKLVQTSSTTSSVPFWLEIEFRILDSGSADDKSAQAPSYSNALGQGRRSGRIAMTSTLSWVGGGSLFMLIDGGNTNSIWLSAGQTSGYLELDFKTPVLITEFTWRQSATGSQGNFKWQAWDGAAWIDIGSAFALGTSANTVITAMSSETRYFERYRITKTSGATTSSPYVTGIDFKIGYPFVGSDSLQKDLILDYLIEAQKIHKDLILDYMLGSLISTDLILDNYIALRRDLVLDYELSIEPNLWQHARLIFPGGRNNSQTFGHGPSPMLSRPVMAVAGPINIPDTPVLPEGVGVSFRMFYDDYYERIWLDPQLIRLVNPRYNTPIQFGIWNSYSVANDLIEVMNIDLPGFILNFTIPTSFARYEFKFLTFSVTPDAPASVSGSFDFIFDNGQATLDVIATIIEVLRVLPNEPVREQWSWKTVMQTSYDSSEQRMAYRSEPRVNMSIDVQLLDEEYRMKQYRQLYTFIARTIRFPFFQYRVDIEAPAAIGDTKLFFDPTKTDLRPMEYAALMNPLTDQLSLVRVATVDSDGCTLDLALDFEVNVGWSIVPTQAMRIPDASSLQMRAVDGQMGISGESMEYRTLLRPAQTAALTTYDGLPVLDYRPIAQRDISEAFYGGGEVIDNESVMPAQYTSWANPFVAAPYEFKIDRETQLDYWRQFGKTMQGKQNPFLMPTWREDLQLVEPAALGDIVLHVDSAEYLAQFEFETYKRLQIETRNGIIYRKVVAVEDDGLGGCVLTLTTPIGTNPGDNVFKRISFLNLARLDNDNIDLAHFVNWTIIGLKIRTINA